jgi:transposase
METIGLSGVLQGRTRFLLSLYRVLYPKCTAAEINCFLYNNTPAEEEQRFFSGSQITRAEDDMALTRKRGATTACQANLPQNIAKRDQFWTEAYPMGILGTPRQRIVDFDEAGIFLETTDRGYGKCFVGKDLNEEGPYSRSTKFTLCMAIGGDAEGHRWLTFELKKGTTIYDTISFLQEMMNDLGPQIRHTFICDNLSSHTNALVRHVVQQGGHRLLFRPPYKPRDGPIEYVFNRLQHELSLRLHEIRNQRDLERSVYDIVRGITSFENYFTHCGYN